MKTSFVALASLLLLAATSADAASVHTHHHKHHKTVSVHAHHSGNHKHQFKATPWDSDVAVKKEKCGDLCYLSGFWAHQVGRNCISRPTDLCMQFKLAAAGLEAVLIVAECSCDSADASAASNSTTVAPQQ